MNDEGRESELYNFIFDELTSGVNFYDEYGNLLFDYSDEGDLSYQAYEMTRDFVANRMLALLEICGNNQLDIMQWDCSHAWVECYQTGCKCIEHIREKGELPPFVSGDRVNNSGSASPKSIPEDILLWLAELSDAKTVNHLRYILKKKHKEMPYSEYLKTARWKEIRQMALLRANHRCQICNAQSNLEVHHRDYSNRGNEKLSDLTVLCSRCHRRHHEAN